MITKKTGVSEIIRYVSAMHSTNLTFWMFQHKIGFFAELHTDLSLSILSLSKFRKKSDLNPNGN